MKSLLFLWSHHEETRELPGQRDNAKNNARCTQARKATHGLDGQHQDVDSPVEESIRMTEDRDKWRKYVHRLMKVLVWPVATYGCECRLDTQKE